MSTNLNEQQRLPETEAHFQGECVFLILLCVTLELFSKFNRAFKFFYSKEIMEEQDKHDLISSWFF